MLRRLGPDVWLLATSVVAAAAVGRLFQGDLGGRAFGSLLVTAAVGSAVPALLALKRVMLPIRAVAGTIAVILTSLWTAVGAATTFGIPTPHTWRVVQSDLRAACSWRRWSVASWRCWRPSSCTPATHEIACTRGSHSSARWVCSRSYAARAR